MSQISPNKQQLKAIRHKGGPLLIIAGAGTGKTAVITERVKYLIQKRKVSPQNILAVTFTDKAAKEMLERLDVVMPLGYEEPWLGTFHAIGDRILRAEGLEIGLDPSYRILTETDQWILIRRHLFDFDLRFYRPLGNPTKFIAAVLKFFSRCQDEDVSVKELEKFAKKKKKAAKTEDEVEGANKYLELARAYETYQAIKIAESALDFGDLINQNLRLFRERKSILKKYRDQFEHILVDEFQDTNYAQYQLIKLLAPSEKNPNLTVTGDDDQSVYKFRGAAISNILDFKKDYPKAEEVVITTNYRSVKSILTSAYKLIQHNNPDRLEVKLGVNKKLRNHRDRESKEKPQIIKAPTGEAEVDFTIKKILELVAEEDYTYKDFAILTRANAQLDSYVAGLRRAGLPYQLIGNRGLFDQEEVRNLIHFLRVVVDPEDSASLFQLLQFESLGLPMEMILNLLNMARKRRKSLWEVVEQRGTESTRNKKEEENLRQVVELIRRFQKQSVKEPVSKLLHDFIFQTGYIKTLAREETIESQLKIKNLNLLFERVRRWETENKEGHLTDFVEVLGLWQEAGENPAQAVIEDIDTVSLLTVHSAKGLEFPVVFVGSVVAGRFPAINRRDPIEFPEELIKETLPKGSGYLEEERRLLYVAMTRARDYLYLSYSPDYGGVKEWRSSGFLVETGLKETVEEMEPLQLSLLEKAPAPRARYLTKKGEVELGFISYSQVDTFEVCPLKYKYRYILKVPAEPHHALSFGQTIHNTLHDFHRLEQQGKVLSIRELLELYKNHFVELGYDSLKHKKERFKAGKEALRRYYKEFSSLLGKPKFLEKSFRLSIAGVPLIGKIDRIDEVNNGFEIVDYKTGKTGDQKKVDRDKQLTIYGMAVKEAFRMEPTSMSLYFIENNEKVTTTRDEKDYKEIRSYLEEKVEEIRKSEFPAKPGCPFPCGFCEYNKICPMAVRK